MLFRRKKTNSRQFSADKMELPGDMQDTLEPPDEIEKARRDIMLACLEAARREQDDRPEEFPHATDQPPSGQIQPQKTELQEIEPQQIEPRETQSQPTEPLDNGASVELELELEQNPPDLTEDVKTAEQVNLTEQTSQPTANGLADLTNQIPPSDPPPTCTIPADQPTYRNKSENIKDDKLIKEILNGIVTEDIARNHKPPAEPLYPY